MKKPLIILLCLILPVAALSVWGFVALKKEASQGFSRNFKTDVLVFTGEVIAPENLIAVHSMDNEAAYFTPQEPQRIAKLKNKGSQIDYETLAIPFDQWIKYNYRMQVDGSTITIFAGNLPAIFTKESGHGNEVVKIPIQSKHFNSAVRYAPGRYFIREYSAAEKDYVVAKVDRMGNILAHENHASYLTHDNGMSSQAHMVYSAEHHRLFLVQWMSNQIRCLDTNLNLVYGAKTIDTFTTANIKEVIKKEKDAKIGTQSAPPRYTNYAVAVVGDYLYSYSKIRADNQTDRSVTLDVFAIKDGSYRYSISLPDTENQNLIDFDIHGNRLVALVGYGRRVLTYEIKEQGNSLTAQISKSKNHTR